MKGGAVSVAYLFSTLHTAKPTLHLKDYSVHQTSLEQVCCSDTNCATLIVASQQSTLLEYSQYMYSLSAFNPSVLQVFINFAQQQLVDEGALLMVDEERTPVGKLELTS